MNSRNLPHFLRTEEKALQAAVPAYEIPGNFLEVVPELTAWSIPFREGDVAIDVDCKADIFAIAA